MQSSRVLPFYRGLLMRTGLTFVTVALIGACGGGGNKGTGGMGGVGAGGAGNVVGDQLRRRDGGAVDRAGTPAVTLTVDAATTGRGLEPLLRGTVASDHANTVLCTAYGRNIQNRAPQGARAGRLPVRALPRHLERRRRRLSGRTPCGRGTPDLRLVAHRRDLRRRRGGGHAPAGRDQLHAAPRWRPNAEPDPGAALVQRRVAQHQRAHRRERRLEQVDRASWRDFVRHLEDRYGADEVRNNWYFEVWNEPSWMYAPGDNGYFELYRQHRGRPACRPIRRSRGRTGRLRRANRRR